MRMLLLDEKTVLFDTDRLVRLPYSFLENHGTCPLQGRPLDYLVINHMEPDHGASIEEVLLRYPEGDHHQHPQGLYAHAPVRLSMWMDYTLAGGQRKEIPSSFGRHTVTFVAAPMVHWPEAMVTFRRDRRRPVLPPMPSAPSEPWTASCLTTK